MRQNYIIIFILLMGQICLAQSIQLDYDADGNRILRKPNTPLPVTLISFTATKLSGGLEGARAFLNWQTSSEINSDHFEIERSQDGKKWVKIGIILANGDKTSDSDYSFTDKSPADGENLYRLKMIDKDGSFAYSRLQSLDFGSFILLYPNPVKDRLKIKGIANGSIQLVNISGKVMYESVSIPADGIEMGGFPIGVYMVKIVQQNGAVTIIKIIKE